MVATPMVMTPGDTHTSEDDGHGQRKFDMPSTGAGPRPIAEWGDFEHGRIHAAHSGVRATHDRRRRQEGESHDGRRSAGAPSHGTGNNNPNSARLGMVWMMLFTPSTGCATSDGVSARCPQPDIPPRQCDRQRPQHQAQMSRVSSVISARLPGDELQRDMSLLVLCLGRSGAVNFEIAPHPLIGGG